jgi:hypothetical protein
MPAVRSLIAAHKRGDRASLQALGIALAAELKPPAALPDTPEGVEEQAGLRGWDEAGTWLEVRAARDHGELTPAEYDYLAAAVEALTMEEPS